MPVINNKDLEKYKKYKTVNIKGKDGITRPITKCFYTKECPLCGGAMDLDKFKRGGVHKSSFIRWKCPDNKCKHSEREQSYDEMLRNEFHPTHEE